MRSLVLVLASAIAAGSVQPWVCLVDCRPPDAPAVAAASCHGQTSSSSTTGLEAERTCGRDGALAPVLAFASIKRTLAAAPVAAATPVSIAHPALGSATVSSPDPTLARHRPPLLLVALRI
jgi:hypothetical protein